MHASSCFSGFHTHETWPRSPLTSYPTSDHHSSYTIIPQKRPAWTVDHHWFGSSLSWLPSCPQATTQNWLPENPITLPQPSLTTILLHGDLLLTPMVSYVTLHSSVQVSTVMAYEQWVPNFSYCSLWMSLNFCRFHKHWLWDSSRFILYRW